MGKKTIAEFVGDEPTLSLLGEYGVDYGQGFHIGHPEPISTIADGGFGSGGGAADALLTAQPSISSIR